MPLNFPTSPTLNQTYVYQNATYIYDGARWKPVAIEYSYSGETKSSNTATVTLDLSNGNLFDIEPMEDAVQVEFINPPDAVQSFTVKVGADDFYDSSWNLLSASYDNVSFLVSGQDTTPVSVTFKPDGTKMYIVGNVSDRVYQYTLATPWNVGTAAYDSVSFLVSGQEATPYSVTFKPDGTKMYIVGLTNDRVYQYTLATPWNVGTAAYDSVSFLVSGQDTTPFSVTFKPDGTKMYIVGLTNDRVYQYTLATPWNVGTAAYDSVSFLVSSQDTDPRGLAFKPDGTKMYIVGNTNDRVYQYTLATPWNVGTAAYDSVSFLVSGQDTTPFSVTFKPDGTKMYILGFANDSVYQYTLASTTPTIIWPTNIEWENGVTAPAAPDRGSDFVYYFHTSDGGTTYYGKLIKKDLL